MSRDSIIRKTRTLPPLATGVLPGIVFFYLIGWAGTFEGALSWAYQGSLVLGVFGLTLWFAIRLYRKDSAAFHLPHRWIWAPVALILVEKMVRAAVNQSWQATEDLAQSTSLALLSLVILNTPKARGPVLWAVAGSAALWSLAGMYWSHQGGYRELALPLGNRTLMAGLLVIAFPLALWLYCDKDHNGRRPWALATAAILAMSLIQTRSAAALVVLCGLLGVFAWASWRGRPAARIALILFAASVLALAALSDVEPINRLSAVLSGRGDPTLSWNNRVRYWEAAFAFFEDSPVFGHGAGQVGILYGQYRIQQAGVAPHGEVVTDVHNVPLNWLVEFGLVGSGLRALLFAMLIAASVISARKRNDASGETATVSVAAYGVFSLAHYQLMNPAILFVLVALAAVASPVASVVNLQDRKQTAVAAGILCAACAVFASQMHAVFANYLYSTGRNLPDRAGISRMVRASILDSRGGVYNLAGALRIDHFRRQQRRATPDTRFLLESAKRHYVGALNRQPFMPSTHSVYGAFLLRTKRPCDAIEPLQKAVSLDFFHSYAHFDLANAFQQCGDEEMAGREAAIALMSTPSFAFASSWRVNPEFLRAALTQASAWLEGWSRFSSWRRVQLLSDFYHARLQNLNTPETVSARLTYSDLVATKLVDDPFAFIFQRRMIPFAATKVQVDGLKSGTWTPEGIGSFPFLRPLRYRQALASYKEKNLDELVCYVGACS